MWKECLEEGNEGREEHVHQCQHRVDSGSSDDRHLPSNDLRSPGSSRDSSGLDEIGYRSGREKICGVGSIECSPLSIASRWGFCTHYEAFENGVQRDGLEWIERQRCLPSAMFLEQIKKLLFNTLVSAVLTEAQALHPFYQTGHGEFTLVRLPLPLQLCVLRRPPPPARAQLLQASHRVKRRLAGCYSSSGFEGGGSWPQHLPGGFCGFLLVAFLDGPSPAPVTSPTVTLQPKRGLQRSPWVSQSYTTSRPALTQYSCSSCTGVLASVPPSVSVTPAYPADMVRASVGE
ncbi:hypothetical protein NDU88_001163 [Pleurodeles waltl]|uniref:Uncharacterized protein n=1 Tax=Pleurodeles waltl TaxID=8319 RepID=A0AAV7LYV9_PLEWA|nr:hypothetical protein NDU88_001163 [Pleurodeles waltl]